MLESLHQQWASRTPPPPPIIMVRGSHVDSVPLKPGAVKSQAKVSGLVMSGASNNHSQKCGLGEANSCIASLLWVNVGSPWLCQTWWAKVRYVKCQEGQGHRSGPGATPQPRLSQRKNHRPVQREAESYVRGGGGWHGAGRTGSPSEAGGFPWGQTGQGWRGPPSPMSTDGSLTPYARCLYSSGPAQSTRLKS